MTDTAIINSGTGNATFDVVTARKGFNLRGTLTTRNITFSDGVTVAGNVKLALPSVTPTTLSAPDVEKLAYASTSQNTAVVIPAVGASDGWDITTVQVCGCPGSGALQTVDPSTGNITYTPFTNFSGTDVFRYTIVDNKGTLRTVFQYVVVFIPDTPPFANNYTRVLWAGNANQVTIRSDFATSLIENDFPIDFTTFTVVSGTFDPFSAADGPRDLLTIPSYASLSVVGSGFLQVTLSAAAVTELETNGVFGTFLVANYTIADVNGNVSNEGVISLGAQL